MLGRQHDIVWASQRHRISIVSKTFRTRLHSDGNTILTKTALSAFSIYPKVTWTYKISIHTAFLFSENLKLSTVDSILTKIMAYFEDKTIRKKKKKKKKTAALLFYTQLAHDKLILQEQHHL